MGRRKNKNRYGGGQQPQAKKQMPKPSVDNVVALSAVGDSVQCTTAVGPEPTSSLEGAKAKLELLEESVNSIKENLDLMKEIESRVTGNQTDIELSGEAGDAGETGEVEEVLGKAPEAIEEITPNRDEQQLKTETNELGEGKPETTVEVSEPPKLPEPEPALPTSPKKKASKEPPKESVKLPEPEPVKLQKVSSNKTPGKQAKLNNAAAEVGEPLAAKAEAASREVKPLKKIAAYSEPLNLSAATPAAEAFTPAASSTPPSTPVLEAAKNDQKIAQGDDETSKIRKILEEASKSLEPVEIAIDEDPVEQKPKAVDNQSLSTPPIKKKAQILSAVLFETNNRAKSEAEKPKPATAKPTKTNSQENKKKEQPAPKEEKTPKANKANTPKPTPKPIEKSEIFDPDMPLDMSIISAEAIPPSIGATEAILEMPTTIEDVSASNDSNETTSQPKNVQGSGFAPSAEETAGAAKSLRSNESAAKKSNRLDGRNAEKVNEKAAAGPTSAAKGRNGQPRGERPVAERVPGSKEKSSPPRSKPIVAAKSRPAAKKPAAAQKPEQLVATKDNEQPVPAPEPPASVFVAEKVPEAELVPEQDEEESDDRRNSIQYKFMPRQVFLHNLCQSCKLPLNDSASRVQCPLCHMVSYCGQEHLANHRKAHDELCAAIQEIAKKRGGHIYNNARILNSADYRSLRVHTLNICENFLKRPLQTFEREILLFPRMCCAPTCREWRQSLLSDCSGCNQVSFCAAQPGHCSAEHGQWCGAYRLYQKLVVRQSTGGRIEPTLPSVIMQKPYTLPDNIDDVFKELFDDLSDVKDECIYATLTQQATAPLTAFYAAQKSDQKIGESFTIHLVGAELQFEADVLDIWEVFFLHPASKLKELNIVFCGPELNVENIPLDIIGRIRMCRACRQSCRIVKFDFQCSCLYHDYVESGSFKRPDLVCFFNPGLHRVSGFNGLDTWSETIRASINLNCPILLTSYTDVDSARELERFQSEVARLDKDRKLTMIQPPQKNAYASKRPERNFISDDVAPLIFKNYLYFIVK